MIQIAIFSGNEMVSRLLYFAANALMARTLGPDDFGILVLAQVVAVSLWVLGSAGTELYGPAQVARRPNEAGALARELMTMRLQASLFVSATYLLIVLNVVTPSHMLALAVVPVVYLVTQALDVRFVVRGLERYSLLPFLTLPSACGFLLFSLCAMGSPVLASYAALAWALSYLLGVFASQICLRSVLGQLPVAALARPSQTSWKASSSFLVSGGAMALYDAAPLLLVAVVLEGKDFGEFAAGYRLLITLATGMAFVASAVYPRLSSTFAARPDLLPGLTRRFVVGMLSLGTVATAVVYATAGILIQVVYGPDYGGVVALLQVLAVGMFAYSVRFSFGTLLTATDRQLRIPVATATGGLVLVVGILLFGRTAAVLAAAVVVAADLSVGATQALLSRTPRQRQRVGS